MSHQLCLKWKNHMNNMTDMFKNLLSTEAMVDVTLACDGLSLKAHKIVLSACSPFFHSLFLENPCKHPIVILKDMKYTELKTIIEFMYHGEINVPQEELSSLMKTAKTLQIKGLAEVTKDNELSADKLSHRPSSKSDTSPSKKRKRRTQKRSTSDQSDDEASVSKTSRYNPASDVEELPNDIDRNRNTFCSTAATKPLSQTHQKSSFHKFQVEVEPVVQRDEDCYVHEEKYSVPMKLLQQTLTTDDLPKQTSRSSVENFKTVQSDIELKRLPQCSTNQSVVPVTSSSITVSSDVLISDQQQESQKDTKSEVLDLEPPMPSVASSSHSADESSVIYMDQSNMSSMSKPSGCRDSSVSLISSDFQPHGLRMNIITKRRYAKKSFTKSFQRPSQTKYYNLSCHVCNMSFRDSKSLNQHMYKHTSI